MSNELPPDALEQQLRRYYQRQHQVELTPEATWQQVASRLAAPQESSVTMNDTSRAARQETVAQRQRAANPPRRGFVTSVAGIAAVILLVLFARTVFSNRPGTGSSTYHPTDALVLSSLDGVSMVTANDGWSVGSATTKTKAQVNANTLPATVPLLFHYDGTAWQPVAAPSGLAGAALKTVAMGSAHDGWAGGGFDETLTSVGGPVDAQTNKSAVFIHYDGTAWHTVTVPQTQNLTVKQIQYTSSGDAWAVATSANDGGQVAIIHEHAGTWQVVDVRTIGGFIAFGGLSMVSDSEGWVAIGSTPSVSSGPFTTTFLQEHNGLWAAAVTLPSVVPVGITMLSATDGWATVASTNSNATALYHYNNGHWQQADPAPTAADATIGPITLFDKTHGWLLFTRGLGENSTSGLYTFDGTTWQDTHITMHLDIKSAAFTSATDGWFVGDSTNGESLSVENWGSLIGHGYTFAHYQNGVVTESKPSK